MRIEQGSRIFFVLIGLLFGVFVEVWLVCCAFVLVC